VDERQQPSDQFLSRRVVASLSTARKLVRFVAVDGLRGLGLIPQLLRSGVAAVSFGASGQPPLHRHASIVPHGCATTDALRQLALGQLNRASGGRSRQLVCRQIGHSGGTRRMTTP
jgi:hypothetical protein